MELKLNCFQDFCIYVSYVCRYIEIYAMYNEVCPIESIVVLLPWLTLSIPVISLDSFNLNELQGIHRWKMGFLELTKGQFRESGKILARVSATLASSSVKLASGCVPASDSIALEHFKIQPPPHYHVLHSYIILKIKRMNSILIFFIHNISVT